MTALVAFPFAVIKYVSRVISWSGASHASLKNRSVPCLSLKLSYSLLGSQDAIYCQPFPPHCLLYCCIPTPNQADILCSSADHATQMNSLQISRNSLQGQKLGLMPELQAYKPEDQKGKRNKTLTQQRKTQKATSLPILTQNLDPNYSQDNMSPPEPNYPTTASPENSNTVTERKRP